MKITNLNPGDDIGASGWMLEMDDHNLLMDAGVHPKRVGSDSLPLFDKVKKLQLDAIAISHCHHDHVGGLPVALQYFPKAHVIMPQLSYFLIERVLHNSVNVMTRQRDELGIRDYPLYTHDELDDIASIFQGFKYNREIEWAGHHRPFTGAPSPTLEFYDAGHALGSAGMMIRGKNQTCFYTGDVCFQDQTLLKAARFEDVKADVLIMETTRGNRATPPGFTRQQEMERMAVVIEKVLARNGSVLIPVFALGRSQEILAQLALAMQSGRLKKQPIYIGGLTRVFTEIYDLESHRTNRNHSSLQLREALDLIVLDKGQPETMSLKGRIFVLTAGMMTENTASHDLAIRFIQDERHAILFVGYADPETPGGRLKAAKAGEKFLFSASAGEVERRCELHDFDLTAHANREDLLSFAIEVAPKQIILGHGDPSSKAWFTEQLAKALPKTKIASPKPGMPVEF